MKTSTCQLVGIKSTRCRRTRRNEVLYRTHDVRLRQAEEIQIQPNPTARLASLHYTLYCLLEHWLVFETNLDDVRVYGSTFEIDFTDSYVVSTQEFERIFTKLRRAVIGWFFRKVAGTEVPNAEPIVCPSRLPGCRMNRTVCQASSKQEKNNEKE